MGDRIDITSEAMNARMMSSRWVLLIDDSGPPVFGENVEDGDEINFIAALVEDMADRFGEDDGGPKCQF